MQSAGEGLGPEGSDPSDLRRMLLVLHPGYLRYPHETPSVLLAAALSSSCSPAPYFEGCEARISRQVYDRQAVGLKRGALPSPPRPTTCREQLACINAWC